MKFLFTLLALVISTNLFAADVTSLVGTSPEAKSYSSYQEYKKAFDTWSSKAKAEQVKASNKNLAVKKADSKVKSDARRIETKTYLVESRKQAEVNYEKNRSVNN